MSLIHFRDLHGDIVGGLNITPTIDSMRDSLKYILTTYGSVLGSINGGNWLAYHEKPREDPYPGGSATGLGWTYLRYPHTAATAWAGMMLLMQHEEGAAVNKYANPYFPPEKPLPS